MVQWIFKNPVSKLIVQHFGQQWLF